MQFIERVAAFAAETNAIEETEAEMKARLTPEERVLVENDPTRRARA